MSDTSHFDYNVYSERLSTEYEKQRPFMMLQPRMEETDGKWYATYWGVVGSGNTPFEAALDFDDTWKGTRAK